LLDDQTPLPESGWECVTVEDHGTADQQCEMCGQEHVRFIHIMTHAEGTLTARMGKVCAAKYGDSATLPGLREKKLKNRAMRRGNWLKRTWDLRWDSCLKVNDKHVSVFKHGTGYVYWIKWKEYQPIIEDGREIGEKLMSRSRYSTRVYDTADEAKLALFDVLWPIADCFHIENDEQTPQ
jgi:hypothetical protein